MLKIGSHVSLSGKDMFLNSAKEAISYNANTFMIYTGAPQNTRRKDISEMKIEETHEFLKKNKINIDDLVVHAPYIINLANTKKESVYELAVEFLKKEIQRTEQMGIKYIVLHPGSHVQEGAQKGLDSIVNGLNEVLNKEQKVIVCLETMAGKGSECGKTFEELKYIIDNVKINEKLGVCLDTCHIHDAGYDLNNFETVLDEFNELIGLDRLKVIHINDSKNVMNSHKDRHENIGYGHIGFTNLNNVVNNKRLNNVIKILETPYINKEYPPYKEEIEMFRQQQFNDWIKEKNE